MSIFFILILLVLLWFYLNLISNRYNSQAYNKLIEIGYDKNNTDNNICLQVATNILNKNKLYTSNLFNLIEIVLLAFNFSSLILFICKNTYFITPNVALEALLKYNGTFGAGSSNGLGFNLGFQIHLPSGKLKQMKENPSSL